MNKSIWLLPSLLVLGLTACGKNEPAEPAATQSEAATAPQLESNEQRFSYFVGSNIGMQFKRDNLTLETDAFMAGLEDVLNDRELRLTPEQVQETMAAMQQEAMARQQKVMEEAAQKNQTEGEAYLTANAAKEGVTTTESGLQYREIVAGEGAMPTLEDTVSVHYRGTLVDGTVFDSSYDRGQPATFPVGGVIQGWQEALQLMQVGDKWELAIPSGLAYGPSGTRSIGPNSTLLFEVELLDIQKKDS